MKKIIGLLTVLVAITLAGCFDLVEDIAVNDNGSGVYQMNMDMSGLLDFLDMMQAQDTALSQKMEKSGFKNIDTLLQLKNFTDTAKDLTKEEKALLHDATMQFTVKQKERVLKAKMTYPFKQLTDISKLMALGKSGKQAKLLMKSLGNKEGPGAEMGENTPAMPGFNDVFDMTYQKGLLERKVNEQKFKELQANNKLPGLEEGGEAFATATMSTVLHLPKPAKKVTGDNIQVSDDKKTVTIKRTFKDVMENPKTLAFRIEY